MANPLRKVLTIAKQQAAAPPDTVEALESEIRAAESAAREAERRVDELEVEKREALLADNLDGAEALQRLVDREELLIEQQALKLPALREKLKAARAAQKEANWQAHKAQL